MDCFYFLDTMNTVAMNICTYTLVWTYCFILLGYIHIYVCISKINIYIYIYIYIYISLSQPKTAETYCDSKLPGWLSGKEPICQCRICRFIPSVGKIPWRRNWQPTPVFLSGKPHGQRSLAGYSPPGHTRIG